MHCEIVKAKHNIISKCTLMVFNRHFYSKPLTVTYYITYYYNNIFWTHLLAGFHVTPI